MPKTLIIFLLPIFLAFNIFGQKQSSKTPKSKTQTKRTQIQIPRDWKLIDLDSFSFLLPESMEDKKARGTDSQVWHFEDSEMELYIDSGMYTNDFQDLKESYEVQKEKVNIGGKNVKIFMWDKN